MSFLKDRFTLIADYYGISVRKLETKCDLQRGNLSNTTGVIGSDKLAKIFDNCPEINLTWLLTGEGEMLRSSSDDIVAINSPERRKIPLYDAETIGGVNDKVADVTTHHTTPSEWIDAGDWFPDATCAIRHYGDSMVEYPSGSILVLRKVEDRRLLVWGRNYCIETTEFRITKQLQDGGKDYLIGYSTNKETYPDGRQIHAPVHIPKDETLLAIYLVLGCVTKEYSTAAIPILRYEG